MFLYCFPFSFFIFHFSSFLFFSFLFFHLFINLCNLWLLVGWFPIFACAAVGWNVIRLNGVLLSGMPMAAMKTLIATSTKVQ